MTLPTPEDLNAVEYDDADGLREIARRMRPPEPAELVVEAPGLYFEFNREPIVAAANEIGILCAIRPIWDAELPDLTHGHYCGLSLEPPPAVAHLNPPTPDQAVHWIGVNSNVSDAKERNSALAHEMIHARQREMRTAPDYARWVDEQIELHPGEDGYRLREHEIEAFDLGPKLAEKFPNMITARRVD